MHFRYSNLMNIIFVTFMYGLAMPILFPIALLGIFNMYVTERYSFAYVYRKPPMIGNRLNESALNVLKFAPVFMMLFGYW